MGYIVGEKYNGFILKEERETPDIDSICRLFEHEKTGARLLYVSNNDTNKVFSISFKTIPNNDTGVAHILEHSIMQSSKNFLVKNLIKELRNKSQNTYTNATTSSDNTRYELASINDKDFINLMDVYFDCVFYPAIYDKKEIFMQEGWRYELNDKKELIYNGIVFNEMKGSSSSMQNLLLTQNSKDTFGKTCYGFNHGGDPECILELTHEELLEYHKKFYIPSNCYIYIYGDGYIEEHLKLINEKYLKNFERKEIDTRIEKVILKNSKVCEYKYPASQNKDMNKVCFIVRYLKNRLDNEKRIAMNIVNRILMTNRPSSLRQVLESSGMAESFTLSLSSSEQLNIIFQVYESDSKKANEFIPLVTNTLKDIVEKGIGYEFIESAINEEEFYIKEADCGSYPKGLFYNEYIRKNWLCGENLIDALEYTKHFNTFREKYMDGYFEKLIKEIFIEDTYTVTTILNPEKGLSENTAKMKKEKLKKIQDSMTKEEILKIKEENERLKIMQNTKDSQEDLDKIPKLKIEEIKKEKYYVEFKEKHIENVPILHYEQNTKGLMYIMIKFDLKIVPYEKLQYMKILQSLLSSLDTINYTSDELAKKRDINIGSLEFENRVIFDIKDRTKCEPQLVVHVKGFSNKTKEMIEVVNEIMSNTLFDDITKIYVILKKVKINYETWMERNQDYISRNVINSNLSEASSYNEYIDGLGYYRFLKDLIENFEIRKEELKKTLEELQKIIINKRYMSIMVACNDIDYKIFLENTENILIDMPYMDIEKNKYNFEIKKENIAIKTDANVMCVGKGANTKLLGYKYRGHRLVLNNILRNYLYQKVRLEGGAYGCYLVEKIHGQYVCVSYRDPNLKETLKVYDKMSNYIENLELTKDELDSYIISTIGDEDKPYSTVYQEALNEEYNQACGITKEMRETIRREILETTLEDLRAYSKMIADVMKNGIICVCGNASKIEENEELFDRIIEI
ncbi:MAG TPA: hypothetical protein DCP90_00045 [Clostridiales bacterium]|nr:MAG: hypothetical protein A2Y22_02640 [Clostridiales bacterium GWD2_32_59]HAN08985.1 hypothetical protein [Clostridiales bacterium]